jgi:hypothetical protein
MKEAKLLSLQQGIIFCKAIYQKQNAYFDLLMFFFLGDAFKALRNP